MQAHPTPKAGHELFELLQSILQREATVGESMQRLTVLQQQRANPDAIINGRSIRKMLLETRSREVIDLFNPLLSPQRRFTEQEIDHAIIVAEQKEPQESAPLNSASIPLTETATEASPAFFPSNAPISLNTQEPVSATLPTPEPDQDISAPLDSKENLDFRIFNDGLPEDATLAITSFLSRSQAAKFSRTNKENHKKNAQLINSAAWVDDIAYAKQYHSMLIEAITSKNIERITLLTTLQTAQYWINLPDKDHNTPLYYALLHYPDCIKQLLAAGADIALPIHVEDGIFQLIEETDIILEKQKQTLCPKILLALRDHFKDAFNNTLAFGGISLQFIAHHWQQTDLEQKIPTAIIEHQAMLNRQNQEVYEAVRQRNFVNAVQLIREGSPFTYFPPRGATLYEHLTIIAAPQDHEHCHRVISAIITAMSPKNVNHAPRGAWG